MDITKGTAQEMFSQLLDAEVHTNPFGTNQFGDRSFRRAERISAAIFLLTNHIPDTDPLKLSIRNAALGLLRAILSARDQMRATSASANTTVRTSLRELISLLRMLVFAGSASASNVEVVIGAVDELDAFLIASAKSPLSDTVRFSKDDFTVTPTSHKRQIKDIKDTNKVKDMTQTAESLTLQRESAPTPGRASRMAGIVDILKTNGELNIKDIAAQLPEYGEKTIQRELSALIEQGIVRRNGLRRWSRYSLAQ